VISVTSIAEHVLLVLTGLAALGAVLFFRMGGVFIALAIICLLLFLWFLGGLLFGS
jgi:hypothetical protein